MGDPLAEDMVTTGAGRAVEREVDETHEEEMDILTHNNDIDTIKKHT